MYRYYLVLGSNTRPEYHINEALNALNKVYRLKEISQVYKGPYQALHACDPFTNHAFDPFTNVGVCIDNSCEFSSVKITTKKIEVSIQTEMNKKHGHIDIDIDVVMQMKQNQVLYYDDQMSACCYWLLPLSDLIPHVVIDEGRIDDCAKNHDHRPDFYSVEWPDSYGKWNKKGATIS